MSPQQTRVVRVSVVVRQAWGVGLSLSFRGRLGWTSSAKEFLRLFGSLGLHPRHVVATAIRGRKPAQTFVFVSPVATKKGGGGMEGNGGCPPATSNGYGGRDYFALGVGVHFQLWRPFSGAGVQG